MADGIAAVRGLSAAVEVAADDAGERITPADVDGDRCGAAAHGGDDTAVRNRRHGSIGAGICNIRVLRRALDRERELFARREEGHVGIVERKLFIAGGLLLVDDLEIAGNEAACRLRAAFGRDDGAARVDGDNLPLLVDRRDGLIVRREYDLLGAVRRLARVGDAVKLLGLFKGDGIG